MKSKNFIDGVEHLHGNLYKILFASIITADRQEDSDQYIFSNPRLLTQSGIETITDKRLAADLRDNIKKRTLLTPLICRWVEEDGKMRPQLVGGDRRYRALDHLISKKEEVVDPRSEEKKLVSAHIAYEYVVCQVFFCEKDLDAAILSWAENKNRIDLTDGHEIAALIELRNFSASDDHILEILQKDSKWLKDTDDLVSSLDKETLGLLCEDKIKRGAATQLSKIEDLEKRSLAAKIALNKSEEIYEQKIESMDKQMDAISRKRGRAETKKVIAADSGDEKMLKMSQKALDRSNEREKDILEKKKKIKPVASKKMVDSACAEMGLDVNDTKKAGKKTIKKILDQIQEIIDKNGEVNFLDEDDFFLDVTFLELIKMVLENHALQDSEDFSETLSGWRQAFPENVEEIEDEIVSEDEDDEEDEDEDEDEDESEDSSDEISDEESVEDFSYGNEDYIED